MTCEHHQRSLGILTAAQELLINDPNRLNRVTTIGVDEHAWRHTRFGDKYVTVIIDLTPTRAKTGHSRLLTVVEGRSKKIFETWFDTQTDQSRTRPKRTVCTSLGSHATIRVWPPKFPTQAAFAERFRDELERIHGRLVSCPGPRL